MLTKFAVFCAWNIKQEYKCWPRFENIFFRGRKSQHSYKSHKAIRVKKIFISTFIIVMLWSWISREWRKMIFLWNNLSFLFQFYANIPFQLFLSFFLCYLLFVEISWHRVCYLLPPLSLPHKVLRRRALAISKMSDLRWKCLWNLAQNKEW